MKAKSIKGKSTEEIQSGLQACLADSFKPSLAIVFLSMSQDREAISGMLDKHGIAVFGATTNGEFIDEDFGKESIAVLLLDVDPSFFTTLFAEYPEKNYREVVSNLAKKAQQLFPNPTFLLAGSHMETDAEQLLYGFEDVIGKDVNVFGGMAGDDYRFEEQFVFTNHTASNRGMIVLALNEDKVEINGRATCGWKAVGTEKTVTKSEGNQVFTIDDIPVLDLTAKYGGIDFLSPDNKDLAMWRLAQIFPYNCNGTKGIRSCGRDSW